MTGPQKARGFKLWEDVQLPVYFPVKKMEWVPLRNGVRGERRGPEQASSPSLPGKGERARPGLEELSCSARKLAACSHEMSAWRPPRTASAALLEQRSLRPGLGSKES